VNLKILRFYRPLLGGEPMKPQGIVVWPGDYVDVNIIKKLPENVRKRFGHVVSVSEIQRKTGFRPDEEQAIFSPPNRDLPRNETVSLPKAEERHRKITRIAEITARAIQTDDIDTSVLSGIIDPADEALFVLAGNVEDAPRAGQDLAAYAERHGLEVVFAACNRQRPCSLPMSRDLKDDPCPGFCGNRAPEDVAAALRPLELPPLLGHPDVPAAVLVRGAALDALREGRTVEVRRHTYGICPSIFVWRSEEVPGLPSKILDLSGLPQVVGWTTRTEALRASVRAYTPPGLPLAFYTHATGPWGGVLALVRLADELRAFYQSFLLHHESGYVFSPRVNPLKVPLIGALSKGFKRATGFDTGVLVSSHWSSGRISQTITANNPNVHIVAFLQDREDLFELNVPLRPNEISSYLSIGRGVTVAPWIVESGRVDLGLKGDFAFIPPGYEADLFYPARRPAPAPGNKPVRILAMWRPQTSTRRGMPLIREVFPALHKRYGSRVSLECFGWDGRGNDRAPDCVSRHHGVLDRSGVAALMRQVDIYVEPSLFQGFGLPGVEAMASGAALVSTACKGPEAYIVPGENALMVPHDNLCEAIAGLVEDAALRARLQAAGPDSVGWLSWRAIALRWVLYLEGVLGPLGLGSRDLRDKATHLLGGFPSPPEGLRAPGAFV